tara:strand:- start:585 stop:929 length:345 start_codon:yes stop_codon:yes gene_type:complete
MNGLPLAIKLEKILNAFCRLENMELIVSHNPSKFVGSAGMGNPSSDFAIQNENSFVTICTFSLDHCDHMDKFLVNHSFAKQIGYSEIKYSDGKALNDFVGRIKQKAILLEGLEE